jgi:hypothetical protein
MWLAITLGKKFGGSLIGDVMSFGMKMQEAQSTVASTAIESIKADAKPVDADELTAHPEAYIDQWVALTGALIAEPSQSQGQANFGPAGSGFNGMAYPMEERVIVFDSSGAPAVAHANDTVTAYGKVLELNMNDITKMPFVGKLMEQEMQKDPSLQGNLKMYFIIAKQVDLVSTATPAPATEGSQPYEPSQETTPPAS